MCFSVFGQSQSSQNHKKADLSLKINFFQNFRSRFGFLVQFYPYPELELKKYAQGQELLIFGVFLKNLPAVICILVHIIKILFKKTLTESNYFIFKKKKKKKKNSN
jgi:hypothetical protein